MILSVACQLLMYLLELLFQDCLDSEVPSVNYLVVGSVSLFLSEVENRISVNGLLSQCIITEHIPACLINFEVLGS